MLGLLPHLRRSRRCPRRHWTERAHRWSYDAHCRSQTVERSETAWLAPCDGRRDRSAPDDAPRFAADRLREEMTMRLTMLALVASITTTRTRRGSFPTTNQTVKCITAGRPTLAIHHRAFHPTSLPPNVAVRRVSETLRRPSRWHHSNRLHPSHRLL